MAEAATSRSRRVERMACPRCAYDLAGVKATWTDACPLRHTCTECGLEIDLVALVGRDQVPTWFVGAPGGWWGRLLRVPGTALRMVVPGFCWQALTVERLARVPLGRLIGLWLPGLLLMFLVSLLVPTIVAESQQFRRDVVALEQFHASTRAAVASARAAGWTPADGLRNPGVQRSPEEISVLIANSEDEWRPYEMAAGYALARIVTGEDPRLRGGAFLTGRLKYYNQEFGLRSIVTPARNLFGHRFWSARDPFPLDWRDLPVLVFEGIQPFLPAFVATLAMPLAFVLIPSTRRRAKVDARMLARLGLLACAGPMVLLVVVASGYLPGLTWIPESLVGSEVLWWRQSGRNWLARSLFFTAISTFWGFLWWWGACHMLRLPRPGLVAAGLFVIPLMVALILLPSDLFRWVILF